MNNDEALKKTGCPLYTFNACMKVGKAVKELGGLHSDVSKPLVAQQMKMKEGSMLNQMIGAAKMFSLITGFKVYRLTELAQRIFFPVTPSDEREAMLLCLGSPDPYKKVFARFDGNTMPSSSTLGNLLLREKLVPKSWASRIAANIISATAEYGVVDGAGILRYDAQIQQLRGNAMPNTTTQSPRSELVLPVKNAQQQSFTTNRNWIEAPLSTSVNTWSFTEGGRTVKLETPTDGLPKPLWEKLMKYLEVLKPSEGEGG